MCKIWDVGFKNMQIPFFYLKCCQNDRFFDNIGKFDLMEVDLHWFLI